MTLYESTFKEKYPYARHTCETLIPGVLHRYQVFAGDYLCAESTSRAGAYRLAYEYEREGLILPDPEEKGETA